MTRLSLPAVIDLPAATSLAEALRAADTPIVLDGAEVERIGIAGLQLLLSAQLTRAGQLRIEAPSEALRDAGRTAGVELLFASDR